MYFMYIDQSGDPGNLIIEKGKENSKHYILAGLIVPVTDWNTCFERIKKLRRELKNLYGLPVREEIHANELIRIQKKKPYRKIVKRKRIALLKHFVSSIPNIFSKGKIVTICFEKDKISPIGFKNYEEMAWNRLLQRYDNYLKNEKMYGIVISDQTDERLVRGLLRKMKVFNPIPSKFGGSYQALTDSIVEDPFMRDSQHSYFIQVVDAIAYSLYRKEYPKGSLKKYNLQNLFKMLEPILLKEASSNDEYGVVRK
jgi:hypothetical protein